MTPAEFRAAQEAKMQDLVQELYDAAVEIAADDPSLRQASFEEFCRVMWPDDYSMQLYGVDRPTFRLALQSAWEKLPR